jgi:hypothetical protein
MAQPNPILVISQPGYATEISVAKGHDCPQAVINVGSNPNAVLPQLSTYSSVLPALAAYNDGSPGTLIIPNPVLPGLDPSGQSQPGLSAIFVDFGPTGGPANLGCIAYLGVGQPASTSLRWLGGAEASILGTTGTLPQTFIQIAPEAATGSNLTLANYSNINYPAGAECYFTLIGSQSPAY